MTILVETLSLTKEITELDFIAPNLRPVTKIELFSKITFTYICEIEGFTGNFFLLIN